MAASPTSIQRMIDCDEKTNQMNSIIADIVPMLHELGGQALKEVRAYLEARINDAKQSLEKETTKIRPRPSEYR